MASPTRWTWVWVNSGSWWWTGKPGMLQSMGSQRVERLNWRLIITSCFSPKHMEQNPITAIPWIWVLITYQTKETSRNSEQWSGCLLKTRPRSQSSTLTSNFYFDANPIISSSIIPFCSCLQYFPAWRSFPMSRLFTSGGQSIGASASASVLPMNIQDWFPLGLTDLISLLSKGLSRVFSNTTVQQHQFFGAQPSLWSKSFTHTWLLEKP